MEGRKKGNLNTKLVFQKFVYFIHENRNFVLGKKQIFMYFKVYAHSVYCRYFPILVSGPPFFHWSAMEEKDEPRLGGVYTI